MIYETINLKKYYPNWKHIPERRLKDIIAKKVMQKMDNGISLSGTLLGGSDEVTRVKCSEAARLTVNAQ